MNPPYRQRLVALSHVGHWVSGTDKLFSGVCAEFRAGNIYGVCGPSGCGKSTLLRLVAGWEPPLEGTISRVDVRSVAWVFQNPHGVARRNALDHVAFPLLARGMTRCQATEGALRIMSLFDLAGVAGSPFSSLSGGEAQRLLLARAFAVDPDVLLVDEPTAQLDRRSASTVNHCLEQLAYMGAIVIVATHDPETRAACGFVVDLECGANSFVHAQGTNRTP
jgi:ABC-type lipoprotein export system ATPase subunit